MDIYPFKKYSLIDLYPSLNNWHSIDFESSPDDPWIYLGKSEPIYHTEPHKTDSHCRVDVELCTLENQLVELSRLRWWRNPWDDY